MTETPGTANTETASDGIVQVLPDTLANKIAAGEVVQRPASVLKELLENSLDSGASTITVVVRQSGSELVQVVDDGCGMGPADALTCFSRHATSKIRDVADLERIRTLGFRGEALASIASVSHIELKTRRRGDPAGVCVRMTGGEDVETSPCAVPEGTSVAVRHLFFNVPARRNFLKTPATEFKHLVETFQFVAVSNPQVSFTLFHDDHEVYRLAAPAGAGRSKEERFSAALEARLADLAGARASGALVPLSEQTSYLSVRGAVGRPSLARRSRGEQYLFVNGRFVRHRSLEHAVTSAYGDLLHQEARPLFAIFLTLDPRHVDVNVHPTKTEVKFDDERGVYGFLRAVVKKALGEADLVPSIGDGFGEGSVFGPGSSAGRALQDTDEPSFKWSAPARQQVDDEYQDVERPIPTPLRFASGMRDTPHGSIPSEARPLGADDDDDLGLEAEPPVWPLHGRYLVTPIRSGLLLVDQRLAHERILYEQALTSMEGGLGASQQLVFPIILDLSPADHALLKEILQDLRSLGFHVEPFGGRTVKVHGVPADIRPGREQSILSDILEQVHEFRTSDDGGMRENLARSFARRRAFRHGHSLSENEARSLIDQLFACTMPYACPRGRPTMVRMSMDELERRFTRS